jgi:outer membrane protein
MKNVFLILGIVITLLLPCAARSQAPNIVYIDIQKILFESDKGKEAKKVLTEEANKLKKIADGKQEELQRMKDALDRQSAAITPDARAEKERQYQNKLKDYQRLMGDYQGELQQKDSELSQAILKDVQEIVKGLGEREKYTLILEKNQGGILYGSPSVEITDKVISLYNEAQKKKAANGKK